MDDQFEFGIQPIDEVCNQLNLNNHALVDASEEQISHKMIQKARKGRKLSRKVQFKVLRALNKITEKEYVLSELFNY